MAGTNLQLLKRSTTAPKMGDIFTMKLPSGDYLFGRVIIGNAPRHRAPMPQANLIYVYRWRSKSPKPEFSELKANNLLIPPVWTNQLPWTKGYFEIIEHSSLAKSDVLTQHCFSRAPLDSSKPTDFVDEVGAKLSHRSEPCGEWSLVSYRWIDDRISDAVGIPRAPQS